MKSEAGECFEQFKEYSYFHLPGCWNHPVLDAGILGEENQGSQEVGL